jgi:hypothetical protein
VTAMITFHPLGHADCTRIDLADGRKLLIDFGNERNENAIDLPKFLAEDLGRARRDYYDVVLFTHLDRDHTLGASEFFWFEHAAKYQGYGRAKIRELWVPAAAIFEGGLDDCARVVRQEARHRLLKGSGIRVFSRPDALRGYLESNNLTLDSRRDLIVNAGQLVPGFSLQGPERAEFFVHCPFGWRQNNNEVVDRNQDSVVIQATVAEGDKTYRALFASDIDYDTIGQIVKTTLYHGRGDRLVWDVFKIPHHCSYTALSDEKGSDRTSPKNEVAWLSEDRGRKGGLLISTSRPIPAGDEDKQPPHRQAANYYKEIARKLGGRFEVTMENSPPKSPKPCHVKIDANGPIFISEITKSQLLRPATAASAGFAFPNRPVAPDKPAGFA